MVVDSHSIRTCHCLVTHARVVVDSRRRSDTCRFARPAGDGRMIATRTE